MSGRKRAAIAVKMLAPLKEEAKKRQEAGRNQHTASLPRDPVEPSVGEAVHQTANLVGVGKTTVQYAKAVAGKEVHTRK